MVSTAQKQKQIDHMISCGLRGACGMAGGSGSITLHLNARLGEVAKADWIADPEGDIIDEFGELAKTTFENQLEV